MKNKKFMNQKMSKVTIKELFEAIKIKLKDNSIEVSSVKKKDVLKTLKDIDLSKWNFSTEWIEARDEIRQELGINWINFLKKKDRKPTHGNCCTCQDCGNYHDDCTCLEKEAKISILKHIFNITEEDLK